MIATLALSACAHRLPPHQAEFFARSHGEPYDLGPGDRLRIIVFGQDSLSNTFTVDPQGFVALPLVGRVPAAALTTSALERRIEAAYRQGFLRDPKVAVEVEQFRPFFILGEVGTSGQYPFVPGMTVQTAVAIAGGFAPRADRHAADVTRSINGDILTATVPLETPVRPGDTITIRERFF